MSENDFIRRDVTFWWNKPYQDDETVFNFPELLTDYLNFSFSFLHLPEAGGNGMCVRFIPNLFIGRSWDDVIFDGGIVIDHKLDANNIDNLKEEILRLAIKSHEKFIKVFEEREGSNYMYKFKPSFNSDLFKKKLSLHQSSFFPMHLGS